MTHARASHGETVIDGKRLETLAYAPAANGPTIVMLHEGLGSVAMWKRFPAQLAERTGCGVFAYSRYGHGKSERLSEKRDITYMHYEATVVLPAMLEHENIFKPILLGHSDGASISIIYAGTFAEAPRGLILEAPHVFVENLSIESIAKAKSAYRQGELARRLARYHLYVDETFWGWNDIWLDPAFRDWNIEHYLSSIACPVLAIQGEDDEYGTAAQLQAIRARLPNSEVVLLPHCHHAPHLEQPRTTLERIADFVRKLSSAQ